MTLNLLRSLVLFLFLANASIALAQDNPLTASTKLPDHPRILLLKGEEQAIQKTISADPTWAQDAPGDPD